MNRYRALQTLALRDVLKESPEVNLNSVFRWYSREFHTPLHTVEELPIEYILQHYYEDSYLQMSKEDIAKERENLILSEEEAALRTKDDDNFIELLEKNRKKVNTKDPKTPVAPSIQKLSQIKDLEKALAQFKDIAIDFD